MLRVISRASKLRDLTILELLALNRGRANYITKRRTPPPFEPSKARLFEESNRPHFGGLSHFSFAL